MYVTDDGSETDLDLGHYYRFSNSPLSKVSSTTSGQIYHNVLKKERSGDYLGQTVQVIPHVTNEIKNQINLCSKQQKDINVTIVEIGGTVGDIESQPFLEAIRQFRHENQGDCINIHLTYIPYIVHSGEVKTKPTQHSVQRLQQSGIFCDMILCRCTNLLSEEIKDKLSLFCNVPKTNVIEIVDCKTSVYEVPLHLRDLGLDNAISEMLGLSNKQKTDIKKWESMVSKLKDSKKSITIGIIGKYFKNKDSYRSILKALCMVALQTMCR